MLRPDFFWLIYGNFFSDLGSGDGKIKEKKALKNTSLLVIFIAFFFFHFQIFFIFFLIYAEQTVKLVK